MKQAKIYKLSEYCPQAASFWDPALNGDIRFEDVLFRINDYFTFKCDKNPQHIYARRADKLFDRKGNFVGCKYCGTGAKEAFPGENDLFTVCAEAKEMWDTEKNKGIEPTRILPGSQKFAWFTCEHRHSNLRRIKYFVEKPYCPDCDDEKQSIAGTYPQILKIWDEKKNTADPYAVKLWHDTFLYFKCPECGYEWKRCAKSYLTGSFCAVCGYDGTTDGKIKNKEYITKHPVVTFRMANPEVADMWDYSKNQFDKNPDSLLWQSNYKASFKCPKGHHFDKVIAELFDSEKKPRGCPFCDKDMPISGENDFFTLCPKAKDYWDYTKNKDIDPSMEFMTSQKRAFFKCEHGHVRHVTIKSFCDYPGCITCKRTVGGHSDLFKFWDSYNNTEDPWHVYRNDKKKEYHWKCKDCGFEWTQHVILRANAKGRCPSCGVLKKSLPTDKSRLPFSEYNPAAAKLWLKTKSSLINPHTVTGRSTETVTMRCINDKRHIYDIRINLIPLKAPYGCPFCNGRKALSGEDFFSVCPTAVKMWDPDKNIEAFPDTSSIPPQIHKYAFFKCEHGHRFRRTIRSFANNPVCLTCGPKMKKNNRSVADIPHLIKHWDNKMNSVDPSRVYAMSELDAYWKCPNCRYEWKAQIRSRYFSKGECPCCETRIVVVPGINDLFTIVPELKKFYDTENNPEIIPDLLSVSSSDIQANWKCPDCGYKWRATPSSRVLGGRESGYTIKECPFCKGYVRGRLYAERYPHLLNMYDKSNDIPFENLTSLDYPKIFKWSCSVCGHDFESSFGAVVRSSSAKSKGCPYCARKAVDKEDSFAYLYPEKMIEYDPENDIDPFQVTPGSNILVKWICQNNNSHRWKTKFHSRALGRGLCPICKDYNRGKRVADIMPELEEYYDKEANARPFFAIGPNSREKRFSWICENGHKFMLCISSFLDEKRFHCPICEGRIIVKGVNDLKSQYPKLADEWSASNEKGADEYHKTSRQYAYWICPVCSGEYRYRIDDRYLGDRSCPYCNGERFLPGFNSLDKTDPELAAEWSKKNTIEPHMISRKSKMTVFWNCPTCHGDYSYPIAERSVGDDSCSYCNRGRFLAGYNSLDVTDPDLAKEWSPNNTDSPKSYPSYSRVSVKWICPTCNGEYNYMIANRTLDDDSCPYCNKGKVLTGYNSLDVTDPDLAKEWSTNNSDNPGNYTKSSRASVLWTCPTCHSDYIYPVNERVVGDCVCPYCNNRKALKGYNTFAVLHKELLSEWDYISNYLICDPDEILDSFNKGVWWKCKTCGRHYELSPKMKVLFDKRHMKSCKYCKGNRRKRKHYF